MAETAIKKFVNFFWGEPQEEDYEQIDNEVEYVFKNFKFRAFWAERVKD